MHPAWETFIEHMDGLVTTCRDSHEIAQRTQQHLAALLEIPEFLEERYRAASPDGYCQHVVHVHPEGRYSVVALVWKPGQATPIHDHRCWCVVGVLQGGEQETRYGLHGDGSGQWLVPRRGSLYTAGDVCSLVPPDEDIHRVANATDDTAISMHIYGADIAEVGTSINRTFDELPVRECDEDAAELSWRTSDTHPLTAGAAQS